MATTNSLHYKGKIMESTFFSLLTKQDVVVADLSQPEKDRLKANIRAANILLQADQCDTFNSDVDEAPTAQTMFMANLSSTALVYDEAGPSYDLDTLFKDNEVQLVQSDASSVPNDTEMMVTNDIYEQDAPCVTFNQPNNTVNASLTAELARYKELAKVYEKRAHLERTE
nr:hypothetical protein [Tanacetum cinerariifolium]